MGWGGEWGEGRQGHRQWSRSYEGFRRSLGRSPGAASLEEELRVTAVCTALRWSGDPAQERARAASGGRSPPSPPRATAGLAGGAGKAARAS